MEKVFVDNHDDTGYDMKNRLILENCISIYEDKFTE